MALVINDNLGTNAAHNKMYLNGEVITQSSFNKSVHNVAVNSLYLCAHSLSNNALVDDGRFIGDLANVEVLGGSVPVDPSNIRNFNNNKHITYLSILTS